MTHPHPDDAAEPLLQQTEGDDAGPHRPVDHGEAAGEHDADAEGDVSGDPGEPGRSGTSARGRRRARRMLLAVALMAGALVAATCWLFVWPTTDTPAQVDVVLVPAGGKGERETTAARLAQEGLAPVIAFSDGGVPDSSSGRLCQQRIAGVRVVCLHADGASTRGEARAFSELAAREGWRSVAVVTSSYHVHRASLLVDRCFEGTVHPVAAGLGPRRGLEPFRSVLREAAGFLIVNTTERGC